MVRRRLQTSSVWQHVEQRKEAKGRKKRDAPRPQKLMANEEVSDSRVGEFISLPIPKSWGSRVLGNPCDEYGVYQDLTELCGRIEPARVAYSCRHKAVNHGGNWARGVSAVSVFHKRVQDSHPPWRRASTEDDVPWVQNRRLIVGGIVIGSFGHKPFLNYLCRGDKGQTSAIPTCVIYVSPDRKLSRGRLRKFKLDLAVGVCHEDQLFPVKARN
jgi:hypothetical protein